jgi:NAD-dependent DNA ligase
MGTFPVGTSFVFVGKLNSMTRDQARAMVESLGGICPSGVSSDLDYLVVGNDNSPLYSMTDKKSKHKKAEALIEAGAPIAIISEDEFLNLIGETPAILAVDQP